MSRYRGVVEKYEAYMNETDTWFSRNFPDKKNHMVAYFSAEYGLNEVLPIYSGGLGVLSGDHCKSASDLGIPFTAIGLFINKDTLASILMLMDGKRQFLLTLTHLICLSDQL